jgi:hypothetical protein
MNHPLDKHIDNYARWRERYAHLFAAVLREAGLDPWVETDEISATLPTQGAMRVFFHMNVVQTPGALPELQLTLSPGSATTTVDEFRSELTSTLRNVADLIERGVNSEP